MRNGRGGAVTAFVLGGTLALAGCTDDDGGSGDVVIGTGTGGSGARSGLQVSVDRRDGERLQWSLECHPAGGTHPDLICTEIYGGPETARVEGLWEGERVVVTLSRTNGCEIDRWDRWQPVLVVGGGAEG